MLVLVLTVGCAKAIELSDEKRYQVAEYAAELLLKYDRNINLKYYIGKKKLKEEELQNKKEEQTSSETTEELLSTEEPVSTEAVSTEDTGDEVSTEENVSEASTEEMGDVDKVNADADMDFDIAAFAGEDRISIKYLYYLLADTYPSYDRDGLYIEIKAPEGYKLLVLKFGVENKTNEDQNIDLYSKDVDYRIIVNDSKSAKQMLTILMDDLYTYQGVIGGSVYEEKVLLFQVSDSMAESIQDLKLKIEYQGNSRIMQLK